MRDESRREKDIETINVYTKEKRKTEMRIREYKRPQGKFGENVYRILLSTGFHHFL